MQRNRLEDEYKGIESIEEQSSFPADQRNLHLRILEKLVTAYQEVCFGKYLK